MNSGMVFQMPGLSCNANSNSNAANTAKVDTRNSGSTSFKKEIDKAYDKAKDTEPVDCKEPTRPSDTKDKTPDSKPVENDKVETERIPTLDESDKEIISEALVLEATVAQLALLNRNDGENLGKVLAEVVGVAATTGDENSLNNDDTSILDTLAKADGTEDGEILLPNLKSDEDVMANMKKMLKEDDGTMKMTGVGTSEMKESQLESQETQLGADKDLKGSNLDGLQTQDPNEANESDVMALDNLKGKNNLFDGTKVNIKVAEAPVDTTRANMADQLADKILYKISQGKQEFELELNPKNLGKINIKMTFENGNAELVMSSSNSKAHQLLANQTEALRAILEGRTGMDAHVNVEQAETNDNQFDRDNFQDQSREQQNQKQQREERQINESVSFMERLRLGLTDGFEEAV